MGIFNNKEDNAKEAVGRNQGQKNAVPAEYSGTSRLAEVIVQPRISEKANRLASGGKYVFKVATSANKIQVKKAVEKLYHVKVTQVNIVRMQGKQRSYGRISGRTSNFKKAIITLKSGDKIEGFLETV